MFGKINLSGFMFMKMNLNRWMLFGWPDLGGWIRRDLEDWIFTQGIWRDEIRNYKIAHVNELEINY